MSRIIFILITFSLFNLDVDAQSWKKYLKKAPPKIIKKEVYFKHQNTKINAKNGLYFEVGLPDIYSQSSTRWSYVVREDLSDSVYFTKQFKNHYKYKFLNKSSNSLVFYKKTKLTSAVHLVTGFGFNRLKYNYQTEIAGSDAILISKFELISDYVYIPGEVKETKINRPYSNELENEVSFAGEVDVDYSIFSLILPAAIQVQLTDRIDFSFNVGFIVPFITHATETRYDFEKGMDVDVTDKSSNIMNRYLISAGFGMKYRFYKNYFFGIDYGIFQNSLLHPSESNKYENDYIKKINMTNVGLKLGIEW